MYLRKCRRKVSGQIKDYWQLVENYRTERGPRQRVVAHLGAMDEPGLIGLMEAASGNEDHVHQESIFDECRPRWAEVDTSRVKVERTKFFGGAWLGLQVLEKLGLTEFLDSVMPRGREDIPWSMMSLVLVLSRLCDPSSELFEIEYDLLLYDVTSTYFEGLAEGNEAGEAWILSRSSR